MFSRQNIIGFFFFFALSLAAIDLAMDHKTGYMTWLLSAPSFLIVIAFSGLTYIKREKYMLHTFLTVSSLSITILYGVANSMISIIYGYILGNVAFTFWPYYSES